MPDWQKDAVAAYLKASVDGGLSRGRVACAVLAVAFAASKLHEALCHSAVFGSPPMAVT